MGPSVCNNSKYNSIIKLLYKRISTIYLKNQQKNYCFTSTHLARLQFSPSRIPSTKVSLGQDKVLSLFRGLAPPYNTFGGDRKRNLLLVNLLPMSAKRVFMCCPHPLQHRSDKCGSVLMPCWLSVGVDNVECKETPSIQIVIRWCCLVPVMTRGWATSAAAGMFVALWPV